MPVKIERPVHEAVRFYSRLYGESQSAFIGRTVLFFVENNTDEIQAKKEEFIEKLDSLPAELRAHLEARSSDET